MNKIAQWPTTTHLTHFALPYPTMWILSSLETNYYPFQLKRYGTDKDVNGT